MGPDLSWKTAKGVPPKFQGNRKDQKKMLKRVKKEMKKSFPQHLDLKGAYDPNELRAKNTAGRGQTQTGLDWHYDSTRISYSSGAAASNRRPKEPPVEKKAAKAKQIEKAAKEKIKGTQA